MDWSVILDGFVLLVQAACFVFLAYSFWLCVESAWAGEAEEPGSRPAITEPVDVQALAAWAHRERSETLRRFMVRAWIRACQPVAGLLGKGEARLVR